ncbi:MAG: hypothetical protein IPP07_21435 [Holophagales bacterium]|nr:hypothetical protein [Holophagales bacterium]
MSSSFLRPTRFTGPSWRTDGTAAGTTLLLDINVRKFHAVSRRALGNKLVFWADDGTHGTEPWV